MTRKWPPSLPEGEQPNEAPLSARLEPLVDTAREATSRNTNRAYAADGRDYLRWRARQGLEARSQTPTNPERSSAWPSSTV